MKQLGAAGAVVNGFHRDTAGILAIDFPCLSRGRYSQDQAPRGKVTGFRLPVEIEGVTVNPGDIVFGDLDGVVIIPQQIEKEIIEKATKKQRVKRPLEMQFVQACPQKMHLKNSVSCKV